MLGGATVESVFNSKINETVEGINGLSSVLVSRRGEEPSQRDVSSDVLVLTLGTDRLISFNCSILVNDMGVMGQAWSEDKRAASHEAFCRSTN